MKCSFKSVSNPIRFQTPLSHEIDYQSLDLNCGLRGYKLLNGLYVLDAASYGVEGDERHFVLDLPDIDYLRSLMWWLEISGHCYLCGVVGQSPLNHLWY